MVFASYLIHDGASADDVETLLKTTPAHMSIVISFEKQSPGLLDRLEELCSEDRSRDNERWLRRLGADNWHGHTKHTYIAAHGSYVKSWHEKPSAEWRVKGSTYTYTIIEFFLFNCETAVAVGVLTSQVDDEDMPCMVIDALSKSVREDEVILIVGSFPFDIHSRFSKMCENLGAVGTTVFHQRFIMQKPNEVEEWRGFFSPLHRGLRHG